MESNSAAMLLIYYQPIRISFRGHGYTAAQKQSEGERERRDGTYVDLINKGDFLRISMVAGVDIFLKYLVNVPTRYQICISIK